MKRIIFAVTTDLNYDQRMQRICSSLALQGFKILLIGRNWKISQPLLPQAYAQHRLTCFFEKGKLFYLEYNVRLFFYLLLKKADAFCAADLDTAMPVCVNAMLRRKPFIFDAHEFFTEVPEVIRRPAVQKFWQKVEKFIVPKSRLRYTVTESLAALFQEKYGLPFEVIRNITSLKAFVPAEKPVKYILYQGAVNEGRGLELLLEIMPGIAAELWICGQGDLFDALVAYSEKNGLAHKVKFLGYVLPALLEEITRSATIGVNLLENKGLSYYYSLANKFFDYLHAGIPQVVINFPEYEALNAAHRVGLTVPLEKEAVKKALQTLLTDAGLYNTLSHNCLKARETLNWQQEEKKLVHLYKNLWPETVA